MTSIRWTGIGPWITKHMAAPFPYRFEILVWRNSLGAELSLHILYVMFRRGAVTKL